MSMWLYAIAIEELLNKIRINKHEGRCQCIDGEWVHRILDQQIDPVHVKRKICRPNCKAYLILAFVLKIEYEKCCLW